jgi:hypothetical protein
VKRVAKVYYGGEQEELLSEMAFKEEKKAKELKK